LNNPSVLALVIIIVGFSKKKERWKEAFGRGTLISIAAD